MAGLFRARQGAAGLRCEWRIGQLHLGGAKHAVELRPIKLYDLGPGFDMRWLAH